MAVIFLFPCVSESVLKAVQSGFNATDPTEYKGPEPVKIVEPVDEKEIPKPLLTVEKTAKNQALQIRVIRYSKTRTLEGITSKAGKIFFVLQTRWKNIHPKKRVSLDAIKSRSDRTMGAGGLFNGSGKGPKKRYVERDVAYVVEKPVDHLFLIIDGFAIPLSRLTESLNGGIPPDKKLVIEKRGDQKSINLVFEAPEDARNIALQFFDYAYGNIHIQLKGNRSTKPEVSFIDMARSKELELLSLFYRYSQSYSNYIAQKGWKFLVVTISGRSLSRNRKIKNIVQINPKKYAWVRTDGGYIYYAFGGSVNNKGLLLFVPEFYSSHEIAFVVPETMKNFSLGMRLKSTVLRLKLTRQPPLGMPAAISRFNDGNTLELLIFGIKKTKDDTLLDLGISPLVKNRGLEINAKAQFILKTSDGKTAMYLSPPEPFVIPPKTPVRFNLVYKTKGPLKELIYRGINKEIRIPLGSIKAQRVNDLYQTSKRVVRKEGNSTLAKNNFKEKKSNQKKSLNSPSIITADHPPSEAIAEQEPNDTKTQATLIKTGIKVNGTFKKKDIDFYSFKIHKTARKWQIIARGSGIEMLTLYSASGKELLRGPATSNKGYIQLDNILFLPGTHYFMIRGSKGKYTLKITPMSSDSTDEVEPNNIKEFAKKAAFDKAIRGTLNYKDRDFYYFYLAGRQYISIDIKPLKSSRFSFELKKASDLNNTRRITQIRLDPTNRPYSYRAMLEPGQYIIELKNTGQAYSIPYTFKLSRLNPYEAPEDLEPNNHFYTASTLPVDLEIKGSLNRNDPVDFYLIPAYTSSREMTVSVTGEVSIRINNISGNLKKEKEGLYSIKIPANQHAYLIVKNSGKASTNYSIKLAFSQGQKPKQRPGRLPVQIKLSGSYEVSSFLHLAQKANIPVDIKNLSKSPLELSFDARADNYRWKAHIEPASLQLKPNEKKRVFLKVIVPPDAKATSVTIYLRVKDKKGNFATSKAKLKATCTARPLNPFRQWAIPPELVGGINVAWSALGSAVVEKDKNQKASQKYLYDGLTQNDRGWRQRAHWAPYGLTVRLAGKGDRQIKGIIINPRGNCSYREQLKDFDLLLSSDGENFKKVLSGTLQMIPQEQAFVFRTPEKAGFVKLIAKNNFLGNKNGYICIGEFKVIALPNTWPLKALEIASSKRGGHIVWTRPDNPNMPAMLLESVKLKTVRTDEHGTVEWVVGFHHNRAAKIQKILFKDNASTKSNKSLFNGKLKVFVSLESPVGPWIKIGQWSKDEIKNIGFKPRWARFVRFLFTGLRGKSTYQLPEQLKIYEIPQSSQYRSILAEWGHYSKEAIYEAVNEKILSKNPGPEDKNNSKERALLLSENTFHTGTIEIGAAEKWYTLKMPDQKNQLIITIKSDDVQRLFGEIYDRENNRIPHTASTIGTKMVLKASVRPGKSYFIKIGELPRSMVFAWDYSGSVSKYAETIYRTIVSFSEKVQKGKEFVNLLPFQDNPRLLLDKWSDEPEQLIKTLIEYQRKDKSSDAELNLEKASAFLSNTKSSKAIVIITDADSGRSGTEDFLWSTLKKVRPRIFSFEVHISSGQDKMQDWASVNNGYYSFFNTNYELSTGFDRAICYMRRPVLYSISYKTAQKAPPGPGYLEVLYNDVSSPRAVEIILDASGSMKKRIGNKRRITIAKEALYTLVDNLPDNTLVALRVYSNKKGIRDKDACKDTSLLYPFSRIQRSKLKEQIRKIRPRGKTPIAYTLSRLADDLRNIQGPVQVVLITDGKESCKGRPENTVRALLKKGIPFELNIIGFALKNQKAQEQMKRLSALTGGRFIYAKDTRELIAAVSSTVAKYTFYVFDSAGRKVASSELVSKKRISLSQGIYTLVVQGGRQKKTIRNINVLSGKVTTLQISIKGKALEFSIK